MEFEMGGEAEVNWGLLQITLFKRSNHFAKASVFLLPKKSNREGSSVENNSVSLFPSIEEKWSVFRSPPSRISSIIKFLSHEKM